MTTQTPGRTAGIPSPSNIEAIGAPEGFTERGNTGRFNDDDLVWLGTPDGRAWRSDVDYHLLTGALPPAKVAPFAAPNTDWEEPEDRSTATLSDQGDIQYVDDIGRPGRIVVVAAEEGTGKSFAIQGELGIRLAIAAGAFAETWDILQTGPVLVVSEMPSDEDYERENMVMDSLGVTRDQLAGRYFRQDLNTAALGEQVLDSTAWRSNFIPWAKEQGLIALIVDPTTSATDADPWGKELRTMMRNLRLLQKELPQLLIILVVHLKKPSGRGQANATRGLDAVMGEYGRLNDVTILMQADGSSLENIVVSVRKRVRDQRRIRLTKRGGLLVDPQPIDNAPQPKVSLEHVRDVVRENPGITMRELGKTLNVAATTASKYTEQLEGQGHVMISTGKNNAKQAFDILYIPDEEQS